MKRNSGVFSYFPLFLIALILFLSSCASIPGVALNSHRELKIPLHQAAFKLEYNEEKKWDAIMVSELLREIIPSIESWGGLSEPITIRIYSSHKDLERAIKRQGYNWLVAWAQYDRIHLQAPSTWTGVRLRTRVRELLTHELTHVAMYQIIGKKNDWYKKKIPLWFREGQASVSANQGYRRLSREALREYYLGSDFTGDLIVEADRLVKNHAKEVYSAAHWAFVDLMAWAGRESILKMLSKIGSGRSFRQAWFDTFHSPLAAYQDRWRDELLSVGTAGN